MIAYPDGLPLPLRDGYGFAPFDPLVSTPLQSGRTIERLHFSGTPTEVSVTWELTRSEGSIFEDWFENTLISGSQPFGMPLKTPLGLDVYEANFDDIYSGPTLVNLSHWRYSAKLRLARRPLVDKDWIIYAPEYVLYSSIFDRAMNKEWPEA
jgi:hypothetical protein